MVRMLLVLATVVLGFASRASADWCSSRRVSLLDQYMAADSAVTVEWQSARKTSRDPTTAYTVVDVLRDGPDESIALSPGDRLLVDGYTDAQPGDRFLLLGTAQKQRYVLKLRRPLPHSADLLEYLQQQPSADATTEVRLRFLLQYVESPNGELADDAHLAIQYMPWNDFVRHRGELPLAKIRQWLADPQTNPEHLRTYGLWISLIGDENDVHVLKELVHRERKDFAIELDGVLVGYLMLGGEPALADFERTKLHVETSPFYEAYAGLKALRYAWVHGTDRFSHDRLKLSLRGLLKRQAMFDLVVIQLAEWHDWSVADQLIGMYGKSDYDIPPYKRAIIRYYLIAETTHPQDSNDPLPIHVQKARQHLNTLREKDPATVKMAEEFFRNGL